MSQTNRIKSGVKQRKNIIEEENVSQNPLLIERRGKIAIMTMNRPASLNALNDELRDAFPGACQELRNDDSVWAVIITGAGRGFCSGADLRSSREESEHPSRQERLDVYGWVGRLSMAIYRTLDKPTIAAVNGVSVGAGMSIALACDIRIGTPNTRFKTVFIERSLSPDTGMSFYLPRIVGYSRACDLVFTSRFVEADEAYRIGLLDRLVPADKLMDEALAVANQIAFWPPVAMQSARRVLQQSIESTLEEQLRNESFGLNLARRAPHDVQESRDSFLERRQPRFNGQ
jgi:2-(1,2-epoxy-1,2-dihydrophenyl)acetyl-CoA isomerase